MDTQTDRWLGCMDGWMDGLHSVYLLNCLFERPIYLFSCIALRCVALRCAALDEQASKASKQPPFLPILGSRARSSRLLREYAPSVYKQFTASLMQTFAFVYCMCYSKKPWSRGVEWLYHPGIYKGRVTSLQKGFFSSLFSSEL